MDKINFKQKVTLTFFLLMFLSSAVYVFAAEAGKGEAQAALSSAGSVNLCTSSLCTEVDEVWSAISNTVGGEGKGKLWDGQKWVEKIVPPPVVTGGGGTPVIPSGTNKCFSQALSSSKTEADAKVITVSLQGKELIVNKIIAPLIQKIDREITLSSNVYAINKISAYGWRCINSPTVRIVDENTCLNSNGGYSRSRHSYGVAIDINSGNNPYLLHSQVHPGDHDLPEWLIQIFKNNGFQWGGDWTNPDYMHFDWLGSVGDFNGDGQLESCQGAPTEAAPEEDIGVSGEISSSVPYGAKACTFVEVNQYLENKPSPSTSSGWKDAVDNVGIKGSTWMGKIASNGGNDDTYREDKGRDTIIFVPCTTDFSKPVELIYFFHGQGGFYGLGDMKERIAPESKILSEQGRNFVMIFPEMSYSKGIDDKRSTSGRSALMWDGTDSNLKQFHDDVITIIKTNFASNLNVGYISMTGHSMGGSALSWAAARPSSSNNYLQQVKPNKIVFSDAGYGSGASQYKKVFNNYIKSNPSAQMFMIVQHPSLNSAHEPTANSINLVKELGGSATSSWSVNCPIVSGEKYCHVVSYTTPGAEAELPFAVPGYPNLFYVPLKKGHLEIGKISLAWLPNS